MWVWQLVAVTDICFAVASSILTSINFFSWISSLCSLVICQHLFIISVISNSTLVRLFSMVLHWLKPVSITHYLANVYDYCWLFSDFPFLKYIKMHIVHLNSLFVKFLHMFVLPDVASACIGCVYLVQVVVCMTDFSSEFTETLKIILSYKSYLAFLWHIIYIS